MVYKVEKATDEIAFDLRNFGWTHGKRDVFQPSKRSLENVTNAAFAAGLDGVAIARCYDDRYEMIRATHTGLPKHLHAVDLHALSGLSKSERCFRVERLDDGRSVYIMRGQMTPTRDVVDGRVVKAHPYVLGYEGRILSDRSLQETLARMRGQKGLVTMVHPFVRPFLGVGAEELPGEFLEMARPCLDYLEVDAAVRGQNNSMVQAYARKYDLPLVAVSNAHSLSQFGVAYIRFKRSLLDDTNEHTFFESLGEILRERKFEAVAGQSPLGSLAWHYFILAGYTAMGVARRDKSRVMVGGAGEQ